MKKWSLLFAVLLAGFIVGCKPGDQASVGDNAPQTAMVSGSVTYRERIALSPEAVVEVSLQDVSRADAAAVELSSMVIPNPGQVPIPFELEYDPAAIDERMTYSIRARIIDRGHLVFTTDTNVPVLTRGAGNEVKLVLVRVGGKPRQTAKTSGETPGMELEGMFRYMADAPLFRDCRDGKTWPVAMEGQYIELERAYLNSGIEPGTEVRVELRGRIISRPSMVRKSSNINLIVDVFNKIDPDGTCAPTTHAELIGTYWRLDELNGKTVTAPEGMKEVNMILASEESKVRGFAGCNNFFGQFESADGSLAFSAMGATMMACPEGMDTEQGFLAALGATARYEISGLFLELFDADDQLLARLEAVYL